MQVINGGGNESGVGGRDCVAFSAGFTLEA